MCLHVFRLLKKRTKLQEIGIFVFLAKDILVGFLFGLSPCLECLVHCFKAVPGSSCDRQIQLWRQASPTHKMQMVAQLHAPARMLAMTGLGSRFPNASEAELRFKLAVLVLGEELAGRVYRGSHAK